MSEDWMVDGRRVGEVRDGGIFWLDDAADFAIVKDLPLPGEDKRRHLDLGTMPGFRGAAVFRGPVIVSDDPSRDELSRPDRGGA